MTILMAALTMMAKQLICLNTKLVWTLMVKMAWGLPVYIDATPSVSKSSSSEIKEFLENPKITVSKETGLSDGDTVDVEITLDEDKAKGIGLNCYRDFLSLFRCLKFRL